MFFFLALGACGISEGPTNVPNDPLYKPTRVVSLDSSAGLYYDTGLKCSCALDNGVCLPVVDVKIDGCTGFIDNGTGYITGFAISEDQSKTSINALEDKYKNVALYHGEHCGKTIDYHFFTFDKELVSSKGWFLTKNICIANGPLQTFQTLKGSIEIPLSIFRKP